MLLQSSGQFVRDFVPPDYVVDRIFQRRFCYSMTAKTGGGKTAAAMRLAAHVAIGRSIGSIEVERGTVIYAAGENPTDVQARWLGVTQEMGIDPDAVDVHFINGVVKISENVTNIEAEWQPRNCTQHWSSSTRSPRISRATTTTTTSRWATMLGCCAP